MNFARCLAAMGYEFFAWNSYVCAEEGLTFRGSRLKCTQWWFVGKSGGSGGFLIFPTSAMVECFDDVDWNL